MNDGQFLAQVFAKQAHQEINLRFRAAPVLHREGVKRQRGNIQAGAGFDNRPCRLHACAMSRDARQMAPPRPATVSVHDDGNMLRKAFRVKLAEQAFFFPAGRFERVGYLHALIPGNSMERIEAGASLY